MIRVFALAVVLASTATVGCEDRQLAQMQAARTEVCACKTVPCAEAAMAKVPPEMRSDHGTQELAQQMMRCLARLDEAAQGSDADPDALPGAAPAANGSASGSAPSR